MCIHKLHRLIDLSCTVCYLYNTIAVYVHPLEHVYMLTLFTIVNSVLLHAQTLKNLLANVPIFKHCLQVP